MFAAAHPRLQGYWGKQARIRGLLGVGTQGTPTENWEVCGFGPLFFGGGHILYEKKNQNRTWEGRRRVFTGGFNPVSSKVQNSGEESFPTFPSGEYAHACLALNERARKRYVCFWCGVNVRAQRFPRQRNWRCTCECAVTPPPTFVNLVTIGSLATHQLLAQLVDRILRYGDGRARAHVQRCPTPPKTGGKHVLSDPQLTYQIWTQSVKPFLRYRSAVCTCARAETPHPWLLHKR